MGRWDSGSGVSAPVAVGYIEVLNLRRIHDSYAQRDRTVGRDCPGVWSGTSHRAGRQNIAVATLLTDVGDVNATPLVGPRSQAFWSVGFLLTAWFAPLTAQQDPVTQTVVDTTAIVSLAIDAADIAPQSEASITQLRDLRSRLQPSQQIEQTGTDLDVLTSEIDSLRAAQDYDQLEDLSPGRLDVLFERWLSLARRLDGWQGAVQSRVTEFQDVGRVIDSIRPIWLETRDSSVALTLSTTTLERVDAVLALADSLDADLNDRAEVVLGIQDRMSASRLVVADIVSAIEVAEAQARGRVWRQDSPPIWSVFGTLNDEGSVDELRSAWGENIETIKRFAQNNRGSLTGALVFLAFLTALMLYLRMRREQWAGDDPPIKAAMRVVERPFAVSLFVWAVATRVFYTDPPVAILEVFGIIIVLSTIPFFPRLLTERARTPYFALVSIFILKQPIGSLPEGSLVERGAWLILAALLLAGLAWLVHSRGGATLYTTRAWRASLSGARFGMGLLIGALLANLLGYTALSRLLTDGVLRAIVAAALLAVAVIVVSAFVHVVFRSDLTTWVRSIRKDAVLVADRVSRLLAYGAGFMWVVITLQAFGIRELATVWVVAVLSASINAGTLSLSLGDVLAFGVTIAAAVYVSQFIRYVLNEDVLARMELPRGVPGAVTMLVHYTILFTGFMLAVAAAGIDLSRLAILAGALGVGIGFGMQDIVKNFISGLILAFERPIQQGDVIQLGTIEGRVTHIGIRSSTVRAWDGSDVIIPNGMLITSTVTNRTMMDNLRRVDARVSVAYDSEPERVLAVLSAVPETLDDLETTPAPIARFLGFGEGAMNFELRAWTSNGPAILRISTELYTAVHKALRDAGITIPFPQRDVHIHQATGDRKGRD